jgi:hypothetical protein
MTRRFARHFLFAAAVAAATASVASARPTKIALTKIDGDASGLGDVVVEALDDADLSIITPSQVDRALDKLGIDEKLADRDVVKLAAELDVDAVVRAAFDRRGHKMQFTIFANGKKGKPFSVEVGNAQSNKFRQLVRSTVVAKLAIAVPPDDAIETAPRTGAKVGKAGKGSKKADELTEVADGPVTTPKGKTAKGAKDPKDPKDPKDKDTKTAKGKAAAAAADVASADDPPVRTVKGKPVADDAATRLAKAKARKAADEDAADAIAAAATRKAKREADEAAAEEAATKKPKAAEPAGSQPVKAKGEEAYQPPPPAETTHLAPAKQVAVSARDDDDAAASPVIVKDRVEPVAAVESGRGANLAAVRANLGVSAMGRSLGFAASSTAVLPRSYSDDPVAGVRFEGELYPFAISDSHGFAAGIGIAGDFDQTLSQNVGPATGGTTIPATERHYSIGLRYRIPFGHTPTSPTVTLGVGYATQTFTIDPTMAVALDLPSVDYQMIDPSAAVRVPLGTRFALTAEGRALLPFDAGQIEKADEYGTAKLIGVRGSLGFEVVFATRFALRLSGEIMQMSLTFDGNGALSNNRDMNPATIDVTHAVDTYFGGAATLGVMY